MRCLPSLSPFLPVYEIALSAPTLGVTADLAAVLGAQLARGDVVLLSGPVGAGKTAFDPIAFGPRGPDGRGAIPQFYTGSSL